MIEKRLVGLLSHAKKYIIYQVIWQWLALLCQVVVIYSASMLLETALFREVTPRAAAGYGVLVLVALRFLTRHTLDDTALTVSTPLGTRRYPLTSLERVDDTQWEKRGILKATFAEGTVTLDVWHHAGMRPLGNALRERLPHA